ncbi:ABC transporter G family member 15-like isoform X2 [Tripterygium wilfordii]|uniref:ABC transporter G family member 15-like isoform X2 n=1 Tax=Tripterygium wilfordii TaxID=458696 RepID=UPI0018F7ED32|nr:ABC transporter G family member 15-like isoform X2 [Tripterygium wilfordii]
MENWRGFESSDDGGGLVRGKKVNYLVWEDVTVMDGSSNKLLSGLSGYAQTDRIMAIMGPSGSGKSTLLDAFAGRLSGNLWITGNVLLDGRKRRKNDTDISYVTQQDVFLGTLTVKETLTYSAHLRLPSTMTMKERNKVVEDTITKMGLEYCADTRIGNWSSRGISSGEKRRLSISVHILTRPRVLFLDEPTTGLDSAAAFFVICTLRNIACDGTIVVCSIHQPSIDVFQLFDDLFLLASGETVYLGEAEAALEFFAEAGFPCPVKRDPADHFLRCITSHFNKIIATLKQGGPSTSDTSQPMTTAEIKAILIDNYKFSKNATDARKMIQQIYITEEDDSESNNISYPSWWRQLWTLTCRSSMNMSRDIGYYWLRMAFYVLVSISAGTLEFDVGTGSQALASRGRSCGFIFGIMICLSIGGLPFFTEEIRVFTRERFSGDYGEAVYVVSNFISSLPFVVAISLSSATILNYMVKFHPGFSHYLYFCIVLFCSIAITEACNLVIAALIHNPLLAAGISASYGAFMMMASNVFRPVSELPKIFWRYPVSYISHTQWAVQGQFKNDMIGLQFDPPVPGLPKLQGETILQNSLGINPNISKWWDVMALLAEIICYKLLFYMALRYKERVSSLFHSLCAKKTILQPAQRPSSSRE